MDDERLPTGDSAWQVSIFHEIEALEAGAVIRIAPPYDTPHARLYSQAMSHPGLRVRRIRAGPKQRDIILTTEKPGHYHVESQFSIHVSSVARSAPKQAAPSDKSQATWLASETGINVDSAAVREIIENLARDTPDADDLIERIFNFFSTRTRIDETGPDNSDAVISSRRATALGANRALIALLRAAHLPARIVRGINLQAIPLKQHITWVEVFNGIRWVPLDTVNGHFDLIPVYYIALRKGDSRLAIGDKTNILASRISIEPAQADQRMLLSDSQKFTDIFNLNRLAPLSREILAILLLLPLGVLSTEIIRQFFGIRTYGTFTPTLLALAVTHVAWTTAIVVIALVTTIGIIFRATMSSLDLHRTPRLAIVFTLVAISMSLVVSGFSIVDPSLDSTVVLLPVVILTMLVDRIYAVYDEYGARIAVLRLVWTVLASFLALLVLLQTQWGIWLVSFPEIHAATLAMIILVGLYNGPRLKNIEYFRWMQEPAHKARNRSADNAQSRHSGDSV